MVRYDSITSDNEPVRTQMTGTRQILISHNYSMEKRKSKKFLAGKKLPQVCITDKGESESVIVN